MLRPLVIGRAKNPMTMAIFESFLRMAEMRSTKRQKFCFSLTSALLLIPLTRHI
ncbi:hypothetical protein T01_14780 [Trichinella spiralis]|uniref:Uncharacterized protein n=1 Tax=Trichinella spiralis TaxID=6334 RepID=A0A0V1AI62_TRISP|nr:hypothetical protein T01_14780 [Trichinella spiralis]